MTKPGGAIERQKIDLADDLAQVISSELTVKVLIVLVDREASPKEIAEQLGVNTPKVSHHVKKLARLSLIECVAEEDVGGVIQHFYRANIRPIVDDKDWGKLSIEQRHRYSLWIVRMLLTDITMSFMSGFFDSRVNRHLSRSPLVVDEQGVAEAAQIQNRALDELLEVEATSSSRLVASGAEPVNLVAAMMCFELPEPSIGFLESPIKQQK